MNDNGVLGRKHQTHSLYCPRVQGCWDSRVISPADFAMKMSLPLNPAQYVPF